MWLIAETTILITIFSQFALRIDNWHFDTQCLYYTASAYKNTSAELSTDISNDHLYLSFHNVVMFIN